MQLHKFITVFQVFISSQLLNSLEIIGTTKAPKHATPVDIDADFGRPYNGNVNSSVEFHYWFTGSINDASTIVVKTLVNTDITKESRVRFQVRWEELETQPPTFWLLPFNDSSANGTLYREFSKTLCSDINQEDRNDTTIATIKVTVTTLSELPVNFTVAVDYGRSNVISNFNETRSVDLTLFSPVYFKLKLPATMHNSQFALLEIWSNDDACVAVALQPPKCPVFDKQETVELERHLTMSKNASVTIEMSRLLEGRFLVFVLHGNDSKCRSDGCDGCWDNNGIVPMTQQNDDIRRKQLVFTVREKITNSQYIFSTLLSAGLFLSILVLFPIIYSTVKTVHRRRRNQNAEFRVLENDVHAGEGSNQDGRSSENLPGSSRGITNVSTCINTEDNEEDMDPVYLCGILEKRFDNRRLLTDTISLEAKKRSAQRYFGTLLVYAIFYILPAVQLLWIYQRVFRFTGDEDICYFNFRCLHPLFGVTAFNHWVSNIGYIILGGLFYLLVQLDQSSKALGVFKAMGIALVIQGVMSGLYHTCPNHISFQFDTCFMYVTAMLCCVTIYQAQHPDTTASAILSYAVVAVSVVLGVAAVVSKVWYFWILILTVHLVICFLVSLHLDAKWGNYKWKFVWPCSKSFKEIIYSIWRPFHLDSFSLEKIALIMFNFVNLAAALVGHWLFQKSQDFASYLLFLFILNLSIFSVVHLVMKVKERKVSWQTITYLILTIPTWSAALYFYFSVTASWELSPAESRILNKDCLLFHFFDNHDIWHFLSAFGMFLNFMFFYTLDEDRPPLCNPNSVENRNSQVKIYVNDDEEPLEIT